MKVSPRGRRLKGSAFEREIVALLQQHGIAAERIPLSGSAGGSFAGDVALPVRGVDRRAECKRAARKFTFIDQSLGANYVLFVRDDRSRPLVVMAAETFAELCK